MLSINPLLPPLALALFALLVSAPILLMLLARQRGSLLRFGAALILLFALLNPSFKTTTADALKTIVAVVVDRSGSQSLSVRREQTEAAHDAVMKKLNALPNLDIRDISVEGHNNEGTLAFNALQHGLVDVPPERVGGAILITDGLIDDVPKTLESLGFHAPVHALITGLANERDRKLELLSAPQFGLIGHEQSIRFRVTDPGQSKPIPISITHDGVALVSVIAKPGDEVSVPLPITHGGTNLFELDVETASDELTPLNNHASVSVEGLRDRMKVLLVSGEPHPGERMWRNLLNSDPAVDLIHFTILRPPSKQDLTPVNELSLIAFPTRDLFEKKIAEFDLIVFDRYADLALLPPSYFSNIVGYVRKGGALLIAAGPEFAGDESPAETPLRDILPAFPDGMIIDKPFIPHVTNLGLRHPVTRGLAGSTSEPPQWGEWTRQISTGTVSGQTIMSGANGSPLLILRHDGEGRVALLMSDQVWLWARQFRGGGPYLDLLRRLAHWLMKEPDLNEEALRAKAEGNKLIIERQTLGESSHSVTLTSPDGHETVVPLAQVQSGLYSTTLQTDQHGVWRVTDDDLKAFATLGAASPHEFQTVLSSEDRLKDIAEASKGSTRRLATAKGDLRIPSIVMQKSGSVFSGQDFMALHDTQSERVTGVSVWPVMTGLTGLLLLMGALISGWLGETGWPGLKRRNGPSSL